jgi:hypothetical protein
MPIKELINTVPARNMFTRRWTDALAL